MGSYSPPKRLSATFRQALRQVERMGAADLIMMPIGPTPGMQDAGTRAGRIPAQTASVAYRAMVKTSRH